MAQAVRRCAPERLGRVRICRIRDRARGALGPVQDARGDARLRGARAGSPSARGAAGNRLARSRKRFPSAAPGTGMNERQKEGLDLSFPPSFVFEGLALGESPSWLRQRILIPPCEGSNPSSPARKSGNEEPGKLLSRRCG